MVPATPITTLGRFVLFDELAVGGMGAVHLGRMRGPAGFGRTVAVKRLHPQLAGDPTFVTMMLDEARLASRIHHPNVVQTLDIVNESGLALVLEYIHGETLASLLRSRQAASAEPVPEPVVRAIGLELLAGLGAAHDAKDEEGRLLGIIHRDVSPQNVMVGADGHARVLDFGVAKAFNSSIQSESGELKGKLAYMAPEHLRGEPLDRRADVYGAAVVLWELATGERLFGGADNAQLPFLVMSGAVRRPTAVLSSVSDALEEVVMKGLESETSHRWSSAEEMALALESSGRVATTREVAEWVFSLAKASLDERAALVAKVERATVTPVDVRLVASEIVERRPEAGTEAPGAGLVASPPQARSFVQGVASAAPPRAASPAARPVIMGVVALAVVVVVGGLAVLAAPDRPATPAAPGDDPSATPSSVAPAVASVERPAATVALDLPTPSTRPAASTGAPPRPAPAVKPRLAPPRATSSARIFERN